MQVGQAVVILDSSSFNYSKHEYNNQVVRIVDVVGQKEEKGAIYYRCALPSGEVIEVPKFYLQTVYQVFDRLLANRKQSRDLEVEETNLNSIIAAFKMLGE